MKNYVSRLVRKDLSRFIYKNGINEISFYNTIFCPNHNRELNINFDIFHSIVSHDVSIQLTSENVMSLCDSFYKTKEYESNISDIYNYTYIKNLFEEDKNFNALSIYKVISDTKEISYLDISRHIQGYNVSLDIKQVAHYCKELAKYNLVKIKVKQNCNNERLVVINNVTSMYSNLNDENKFNSEMRQDSEDSQAENQDIKEEVLPDEEAFNFDTKSFYKYTKYPDRIMQMTKEEKNFLKIKNHIHFNKNYLENRFSFSVDEMSIENNILFHLIISKDKGLTINEINFLLGLQGKEKSSNRILTNMEKNGMIKHSNLRKGKKYEFNYTIVEDNKHKIPKRILYFAEQFERSKIEVNCAESKPSSLNNIVKSETQKSSETSLKSFKTKNRMTLDSFFKSKPKEAELIDKPNDVEKVKVEMNKITVTNYVELNTNDFLFILNHILTSDSLFDVRNKNNIKSMESVDYSPESKKNIILDYLHKHFSLFKIKSINDVAYNRYIFTLNKLNHKKVISINDIKNYITSELENKIGFMIDRKTIKNILINLEKLGLIKTFEFELTMKNKIYEYKKSNMIKQTKLVGIKRDFEVTDEILERLQETLKPNQKKIDMDIIYNDSETEEYEEPPQTIKQEINVVKEQIENLTQTFDLKVNYCEKNVLNLTDKLKVIKNRHDKLAKILFYEKLAVCCYVKENLKRLFSNNLVLKRGEIEDGTEIEFHQILSKTSLDKVILPKFMKDKFLKKEIYIKDSPKKVTIDSFFEDDTNKNDDLADLISKKMQEFNSSTNDEFYKYDFFDCFNLNTKISKMVKSNPAQFFMTEEDIEFANKHFKQSQDFSDDSELKSFLKSKRERNEDVKIVSYGKITKKQKKFCPNNYKKTVDLLPMMKKIYLNPHITVRKLNKIMPTENITSDLILYLSKMGLISISHNGLKVPTEFYLNQSSKNIITGEVSLQLDPNFNNFIEFSKI